MKDQFKIGDHVSWNSEAGRVSGAIVRVHTRNFEVNGYTHHASAEAPQYEISAIGAVCGFGLSVVAAATHRFQNA